MNQKTIALILAWASALGVSYFAFDLLVSLGDWAKAWATQPLVLILSLVVALVPACAVWLAIILIEQAPSAKSAWLRLLGLSVAAWGWLYIGSVIVALMRFQ